VHSGEATVPAVPRLYLIAALFVALPAAAAADPPVPGSHDKAWWREVVANDYQPPSDASIEALTHELSHYLGSSDPELRDEIAYSTLTNWLYVKHNLPAALQDELVEEWRANLGRGIGEQGTDSVFLRSFSVLMLSVAAALDNEAPWLDEAQFDELLDAALSYLRDERDTRGFDADKGWVHSVAHTADLLKFLGRNRQLEVPEQADILAAISAKLAHVDHGLSHGEDERLARAVLSIVARPDSDMAAFRAFLDTLKPAPWPEGLPTPAELAVNQNRKHLAVSLYAVLSADEHDLVSLQEAKASTLDLLRQML
jgi:hypothetical protein